MDVTIHPDARTEIDALPTSDRKAMDVAIRKLRLFGSELSFPHQSAIRGGRGLRELRPRAGHSPWRAIYRRSGDAMMILAIGPEAEVSRHGFEHTVTRASRRSQR